MSYDRAIPVRGVRIERLTDRSAHRLEGLVEGIRLRSEDAFRAVYDIIADDLLSFAYGMVSDRRTAEDIVQESFVELVRAAPRLRGDGKALASWLYRSVRFGCLDEYRRRRRRPEIPTHELPDAPFQDPDSTSIDPDLEMALSRLSDRHRTLILLRHVAGLSGEEIALIMKSGRKAVYGALSRAEANLRKYLDPPT